MRELGVNDYPRAAQGSWFELYDRAYHCHVFIWEVVHALTLQIIRIMEVEARK